MVKLSDLRDDSWLQIEGLLKAGGQPTRANLAAALRRNEPTIPGIAQDHMASLLTGKIKRRRGGQALPVGEHPAFYPAWKKLREQTQEWSLIITVVDLAKEKKGDEKARIQAAIEELAATGKRRPSPASLRRRYTKACTRWPETLKLAMQAE